MIQELKVAFGQVLGVYNNSYDNKYLLIIAIQAYLDPLVLDGILDSAYDNKVYIDVDQPYCHVIKSEL